MIPALSCSGANKCGFMRGGQHRPHSAILARGQALAAALRSDYSLRNEGAVTDFWAQATLEQAHAHDIAEYTHSQVTEYYQP